ncbi:HK97-gp10 family putative phage morphogenesis protein [Streptomyces sp. NPDC018833]|uniref:HK97-gp10 family putative phage morphogenesis protein n=1 Tax=Streptomyces sp. NPDC018833 TaxID=3365053 RepID=UPI0037A41D76
MAPRRGGRGGGGSVRRQGPVTVSIEGLDRLADQLEELETSIRHACFRAVKEASEAVVADVKAKVRVDSHNLQNSVKARYRNNEVLAEVGWWDADDQYAIYHEFGTKKMPANPSLGPALEQERTKIGDRIKAEVKKVLP